MDFEPPEIPDDFGFYFPNEVFTNLNFLEANNILPDAGGLSDQDWRKIQDIRTLSQMVRRRKWELREIDHEEDLYQKIQQENEVKSERIFRLGKLGD